MLNSQFTQRINPLLTARFAVTLAAFLALGAGSTAAQGPATWDASRLQLTRAELELLLERFEQTSHSVSYSNQFRLQARSEAERVRRRLADGDLSVGDKIELAIEGESNMPLPLTVGPGRKLAIPSLGELSLDGVLRSELNDHVQQHVSRYIKDAVVRTRSSVRILVTGQVGSPGFIDVPAEAMISAVITQAGGPTPTAKLTAARIERGSEHILEGQAMQDAITEGRTLDQMSVRSGDQLHIPADSGARGGTFMRLLSFIPVIIIAASGLAQIM